MGIARATRGTHGEGRTKAAFSKRVSQKPIGYKDSSFGKDIKRRVANKHREDGKNEGN